MLRIDKIFVKVPKKGPINIMPKVTSVLDGKLKEVASATNFKLEKNETQIEVILEKPISLQTANKIINAFRNERLIIHEVNWKRKQYGAVILGYLEIIVS